MIQFVYLLHFHYQVASISEDTEDEEGDNFTSFVGHLSRSAMNEFPWPTFEPHTATVAVPDATANVSAATETVLESITDAPKNTNNNDCDEMEDFMFSDEDIDLPWTLAWNYLHMYVIYQSYMQNKSLLCRLDILFYF